MKKYAIIFLLASLSAHFLYATHLRAGEILVEPVGDCSSFTYNITIVVYLNSSSLVRFGGPDARLKFGDGTEIDIPEQPSTIIDANLHIARASITFAHSYAQSGVYLVSYDEPNRNGGILNMLNSGGTLFHLETSITLDPNLCTGSPVPLVPPVDRACSGDIFYHDASARADGDSIAYALTEPLAGIDQPVNGYSLPNLPQFYTGLDYNNANEAKNGQPTISIDPVTGLLTWDAPGLTGEYGLAIKISRWHRSAGGSWIRTGYVIRDMQVIVEDCNNHRPSLSGPDQVCGSPTHPVDFTVTGTDPDKDSVKIEAFSETLLLSSNPAQVTPSMPVLQPYNAASIHFTWDVDCSNVRQQPYTVVFKISDSPPMGPPLVGFKNVSVQVVGDPPVIQSLTYNPITRKNKLQWQTYPCSNTTAIQVWRRIAKFNYNQAECEYGMPPMLHYELVAALSPQATSYTDSDVELGPQYCYRVLALIGDGETPSRLSLDTCIIPSPVRPPVITQVSVVTTDSKKGQVRITWTSPRDIDKTQYPPPYTYELLRSSAGTNEMTGIGKGTISDTTYLDKSLNTHDSIYDYRVMLHVPKLSEQPIDSSGVAATPRLEQAADLAGIRLRWSADVPWSNFTQRYPFHYIYRSNSGKEGSFELIDSVNVLDNEGSFFDDGSRGQPLIAGQRYYYKIETAGSYGNPELPEPLLNFSQIVDTPTLDTIPPCTPVLTLEDVDCGNIPCDQSVFANTLHWNACSDPAAYYDVFASAYPDSAYVLLADHLKSLTYTDEGLPERARCYKIVALNAFGYASDSSNLVIAENCTGFKLPNVFSPQPADGFNDNFLPIGFQTKEECHCDPSACYRSVASMSLKVYDRWGTLIFSGASTDHLPVVWSGKNNGGRELSSGTYYYMAHVNFQLTSWKQEGRDYKGWVQLLR